MPERTPGMEEFIELVREHQASLRAFVRLLGVERDWVDDVAQETFLVAHRRLADYDRTRSFARWLRGIARNIAANEKRKDARRCRLLNTHLTDVLMDRPAGDEEVPETAELVRAMNQCLEELPERSREILRRRYAGQENATALSRQLRMSPESVRQMLMKVRTMLQNCIQGKIGEIRV